ncbi:MAG: pseudouridine synthase [Chitinophagaceae bacterium]
MSKQPFEKFINQKPAGAKKKELIRQEKKKAKAKYRAQKSDVKSRKQEEGNRKYPTSNTQHRTLNIEHPTSNIQHPTSDLMPLNKFIAHAGICGRREAAELIKQGNTKVNGNIIFEPGYKVSAKDKVEINGKQIFAQKNLVYILVNKPKDYITTTSDPEGRKTIFDLLKNVTQERIYPVGRLDRNTTGVLLMTNDGELAQKLTHPSFEIKKIYEVKLDKPLTKKDFEAILNGITLEDGFVKADAIAYADAKDKSIIGIEIHSGRNRIVRRIFEHLDYKIRNLDRVMFANLTKKNVQRGKWRFLNEREIRLLKFMNKSFVRATL